MTHHFDGQTYILVLQKGEELLAALGEFARTANVATASVTGLGGAQNMELGFYNLQTKQYQWRTFNEGYEITGLHGTLASDEQERPALHLHGTFADESYRALGGHVRRLTVGATCELIVRPFATPLVRKPDNQTGLNLLSA